MGWTERIKDFFPFSLFLGNISSTAVIFSGVKPPLLKVNSNHLEVTANLQACFLGKLSKL